MTISITVLRAGKTPMYCDKSGTVSQDAGPPTAPDHMFGSRVVIWLGARPEWAAFVSVTICHHLGGHTSWWSMPVCWAARCDSSRWVRRHSRTTDRIGESPDHAYGYCIVLRRIWRCRRPADAICLCVSQSVSRNIRRDVPDSPPTRGRREHLTRSVAASAPARFTAHSGADDVSSLWRIRQPHGSAQFASGSGRSNLGYRRRVSA